MPQHPALARPLPRPHPVPLRSQAVEALLRDLGSRVQRGGGPAEPAARCATGVAGIDRLLGGGIPRGRLSELAGAVSSGRTSLALSLLARTTRRGEVVAWIDTADRFDPLSAAAAGADLSRVLWVRAPGLREALQGAEHLLAARGFPLVVMDLSGNDVTTSSAPASTSVPTPPSVPTPVWTRLRKAAAGTQTGLVVLSEARVAGTAADLAVELGPGRARFTGTPPLLEGLEGDARLVRNRLGPPEGSAPVSWPVTWPDRRRAEGIPRDAGQKAEVQKVERDPGREPKVSAA